MDENFETRSILKELHEYKKEIILLEKELKKQSFEASFLDKKSTQEKLRLEMQSLASELRQLKLEVSKIRLGKEEAELEEAEKLRKEIEAVKKENSHLLAQEEQLKKTDFLLDTKQQNYIFGVYQRRLGPVERENAEIVKKVKRCEEDIEKLKGKCEKVRERYPGPCVERLKTLQDRFSEVLEQENNLKLEVVKVEKEITQLKEIPKLNPEAIFSAISEISALIDKEKIKTGKLERKIKEKNQELRLAKLTIPKSNGSHALYKEIELLSCILVDKIGELCKTTEEIEEIQKKLSTF